ncbi:acyltransferase family protein [Bdellovibrio sp.]|uniref:acyltransferase family protein n=1 Tax=Bdellovibrio sp. TaxID=28201 RepID=UPI0039E523A1
MKYRSDIDGLRAIAILMVLGFHAFPGHFAGGFAGVDVFFVISGFLISTIILKGIECETFKIDEFISRRILRIFPSLLLMLVVAYSVGFFVLFNQERALLGKHIASGASFISNIILYFESGYFDHSAEYKPLLHLWSLGVEEQFYIIWPTLLWVGWKLRLNLLKITLIIFTISFALGVLNVRIDPSGTFFLPQYRFWEILTGGSLAFFLGRLPQESIFFRSQVLKEALSTLALSLIISSLWIINKYNHFPGFWALLPVSGTAILILFGENSWVSRRILSNKFLVAIGLISFPLYLWHWPILSFMHIIEGTTPSREARVIALVLSFALAGLTYRYIENPIRQRKVFGRFTIPALVFGMLIVGGLGAFSYSKKGNDFRHEDLEHHKIYSQFSGPLWRFSSNAICNTMYPYSPSAHYRWWFCIANKEKDPTLILLGNSYANQLFPGIVDNTKLNHHSVLSIGACNLILRPTENDHNKVQDDPCSGDRAQKEQDFINSILLRSKTTKFAILSGIPPNLTEEDVEILRKRINFLESLGIRAIIFTPLVDLGYSIQSCFKRPLKVATNRCDIEKQKIDTLSNGFMKSLEKMLKKNPKVLVFDQNQIFCQDEMCSAVRDGNPLFRDNYGHLSEYGSYRVGKAFELWATSNLPEVFEQ